MCARWCGSVWLWLMCACPVFIFVCLCVLTCTCVCVSTLSLSLSLCSCESLSKAGRPVLGGVGRLVCVFVNILPCQAPYIIPRHCHYYFHRHPTHACTFCIRLFASVCCAHARVCLCLGCPAMGGGLGARALHRFARACPCCSWCVGCCCRCYHE